MARAAAALLILTFTAGWIVREQIEQPRPRISWTIPAPLVAKEVRDLEVGESGWTVPWAVAVDPASGRGWIAPRYEVSPEGGGTAQLLVGRGRNGVWIDIRRVSPNDFHQLAMPEDTLRLLRVEEVRR